MEDTEKTTEQKVEQKQETISKTLLAFNSVLVLLVVFMSFVVYSMLHNPLKNQAQAMDAVIPPDVFVGLDITAKSVYVFDINENRVLYKKNEFSQLPLASITKLMTALVASDILPKDSQVKIRKEFLQEEGDSGLLVGESWKLQDLLDFSLVISSNDGARSLASVAGAFSLGNHDYDLGREEFVSKMNLKAQEIGLKQTYFVNESGLDEDNIAGGYGSAIDVSNMMKYILENKPEVVESTKHKSLEIKSLNKVHLVKNTDLAIGDIPGLLASKTGYTNLAGGNLVIAFDASIGHQIVVVVLGSTLDGRFEDITKLVHASLEYVRN